MTRRAHVHRPRRVGLPARRARCRARPASRNSRPSAGLIERAATALGSGTSSESDTVRRAAVTDRLQAKADATEELSRALPANPTKPAEYALDDSIQVPKGEYRVPNNLDATASTISETNENDKNGPKAESGTNPNTGPLARHRVDSGGRALTTNQGVAIADNQNSLRGRAARADAARGLHPAREDHPLRPREDP